MANNRPNSVSGVNVRVNAKSEGLEFMPERIFIGNLAAYEKREVNFTLTPLSAGDKDISFEVEYKNGKNIQHSELASSVRVKSGSDVKLILVNVPDLF